MAITRRKSSSLSSITSTDEVDLLEASSPTPNSSSKIVKNNLMNVFLSFYPGKEEKCDELAQKIEEGMSIFYSKDLTSYKAKYRSISYNLKDPKNSKLRNDLWKGELDIDDFVQMSTSEMANDDIILQKQKVIEEGIKMVVLDTQQAAELSSTLGNHGRKNPIPEGHHLQSPASNLLINSIMLDSGNEGDVSNNNNDLSFNTTSEKTIETSNSANTIKERKKADWFTCIFALDICPLFDVDAHAILNNSCDGRSIMMESLPQNMHLAGRIDQERASSYCEGIWKGSSSRYIDLVVFSSPPEFSSPSFDAFVEYFSSNRKWATVVVDVEVSAIRDFYLISLRSDDDLSTLPPSIMEIIDNRDLISSTFEYPLILAVIISAYKPKETKSNTPFDEYDPESNQIY